MKQENGTDLLGVNDPLGTDIGIIHVSPADDRKSVLAAILTQEKLGRKQIAVELPAQNKAFQRPVDFDDLRSLRRKLQAQLVFIAPSGPGPAEFARQRRFTVYSSLDNYASALRDQESGADAKKKVRGLFGSSRYRNPLAPAAVEQRPEAEEQVQDGPRLARRNNGWRPSASRELYEDEPDNERDNGVAPALLGGAAAGAALIGADALYNEQARSTPHLSARRHDEENVDNVDAMSVADAHEMHDQSEPDDNVERDDDSLPPPVPVVVPAEEEAPAPARNAADSQAPAQPGSPEAIDLQPVRSRGHSTLKLPQRDDEAILAGGALAGSAIASRPPQRTRNSGKLGAVAAGSAVAASAALAHSATTGGGGQPPRGNTGPGGGGPRRRRSHPLLAALLILAVMLVVFAILYSLTNAYPKTFALPGIPGIKSSSPATVTITPDSKEIGNSYVILAVPNGTPNADQRQIAARTLSSQPVTQTRTVNGTGHNQVPAATASGRLTFTNGASNPFTVAAGTQLQAANGASVVTDGPITIPAANPALGTLGVTAGTAHASAAGANGNIAAGSVSGTCCSAGNFVTVRNNNAFSGGVDPKNYNFVQQGDVDAFVTAAQAQLTQQANAALRGQLKPGEQLAAATNCPATVSKDRPVGDQGVNIASSTVTVSVTCQAQAYDQNGMQSLVSTLLQQKARTDVGAAYSLQGPIITHAQVQQINADHSVSLLVTSRGLWVYQVSNAQKQQLARLIAGKASDTAKTLLLAQVGVHDATISTSNNVLPSDPSQISIIVQNVPALQDTITPTPFATPGSTSPGNGTPGAGPNSGTPASQPARGDGTSMVNFGIF